MENNNNEKFYNKEEELSKFFKKKEKQKLLRRYRELEAKEASASRKISWYTFTLLIVNPLVTAGTAWWFRTSFKEALKKANDNILLIDWGQSWNNLKYTAIGIAISFTINSLTLCYYLWSLSSVKGEKSQISQELSHNE